MQDESLDLDTLAASLQADHGDVRMLLRVLAERLSGSLGDRCRIDRERSGRLLRKSNEIRQLSVTLGDDELTAGLQEGRFDCSVAHRSGGIRIRSEKVTLGEWLRKLLASLKAEAVHSEASRAALESIVIGTRHDG